MAFTGVGGYMGKILRVDLTNRRITEETPDEAVLRKYVGGTGLGAKYLYEEVPRGVDWSNPQNRLLWFAGPINGTRVAGSGTSSVVSKGPMTNMAAATQANGFLGAYLKLCGIDGIIIHGASENWVYLAIDDGKAELRDARHLLGKGTRETENALEKEIGAKSSVYSIGPAGENMVRFAGIVGDHGHAMCHNGVGAVMGSKRLKAVAVVRGRRRVRIMDGAKLNQMAAQLFKTSTMKGIGTVISKWGTLGTYPLMVKNGILPIKNYTAQFFPDHEKFIAESIRTRFKIKWTPCWGCRMRHCHQIEITEGPYKGLVGEEPEYEAVAATSSLIGQGDPAASIMLSNLIDWLGMDCNECGYLIGWVMECYERGILTKANLDGLEMTWGNVEATAELLRKIAKREGCGDMLAEGVKRAAEHIGGDALNYAVYTQKGASPRGHDHRARWSELIDTCTSNTGTVESTGGTVPVDQIGLAPAKNPFDPEEVSTLNAGQNGYRQFQDSLCMCRFCCYDLQQAIDTLNAVTGWDFTLPEALDVGKRAINLLRIFNFRHGLTKDLEAPSVRYSSESFKEGPGKGISIAPHWDFIRRNYYKQMGWDPETGKPLPQTLTGLGLNDLVPDLEQID